MAVSDADHFSLLHYGSTGYVLQDVPHFSDYIPHLPVRRRFPFLSFLILITTIILVILFVSYVYDQV